MKGLDDITLFEDSTLIGGKKHLGTPYQRGGTTPTGFDTAEGFTQYVYKEAYRYCVLQDGLMNNGKKEML